MQRRYNLAHLILASVVALGLASLMVAVDAQARIAFMSDRDWHWEIYVMDADGGNPRNLTNNPAEDMDPSWSPDGKRIAFTSDRSDRDWNRQIYAMDADGGNQRNLSNNDFDDRGPSWSPDGKRIVFMSNRDGHVHIHGGPTFEIYVMDADGGNQQNLTNNPHDDSSPSWSPDGKRIAFESDRDNDRDHNIEIYVMDADGGNQQRLTENRIYDLSPSWLPDGERIAFWSYRKGHFQSAEIYVMDADGGNQQRLTNNRHADFSPAWFSSPFSVSPAGKKFTMWGWVKQVGR